MDVQNNGVVTGVPVANVSYATEVPMTEEPESLYDLCHNCKQDRTFLISNWLSKFKIKANNHLQDIGNYVNLRPKVSQIVRRNLDKGARFIKTGGKRRVFKKLFSTDGNEKLVITSKCYLFTTAGPIAGTLFISNVKIAFLSDKSLKLQSTCNEKTMSFRYKVSIPLSKIKSAHPVENSNSNKKYLQITTCDEHEFWFMGFVRYRTFFKNLQDAITKHQLEPLFSSFSGVYL